MTKKRSTKADETPEFLAFWDAWRPVARHTDGRGLARDAFCQHVADGADPQDIVDGAKWFIRGVKDKQFVPLSATWLNRCAYEDMAEEERKYQARLTERAGNVVPMRAQPVLPDNHFSKRWERGEIQRHVASAGRQMETE